MRDEVSVDQQRSVPRSRMDVVVALLATILGLLLLATLHFAAELLIPIILAILFYLTLSPVVRWLSLHGLHRLLAAPLVVLSVLVAALGAGYALSTPATEWVARLPTSGSVLRHKLRGLVEPLRAIQEASETVEEATSGGAQKPQPVVVHDSSTTIALFTGTGQLAASGVVVVVLTLSLLVTDGRVGRDLVGLLPSPALCRRALRISHTVKSELSTYFLTISAINLGLGVAIGLAMWTIGLPNPALWGALGALLNYLPIVGPAALMALVFVAGLLALPTAWAALLPPVTVLILNIVESQFLTPALLGLRLSLSPVVVLIAIVFWGWLWGIAGVFLSVPILVVAKVACDHVPALVAIGRVIGRRKETQPAPVSPVRRRTAGTGPA